MDAFRFKCFSVRHDRSSMKVGTDGVLLGAWCSLPHQGGTVLDIGTGCGLIALMCAQRTSPDCRIDALDIDGDSCSQAEENFSASPWPDKLFVHHTGISEYAQSVTGGRVDESRKYDSIVSNPPFFANSLGCPDRRRDRARHCATLDYPQLCRSAAALLGGAGTFSVILPADQADGFMDVAREIGLYLSRRTDVLPRAGVAPKRSLMEFMLGEPAAQREGEYRPLKPAETGRQEYPRLVIEEGGRHCYSEDYRRLTGGFYINLS